MTNELTLREKVLVAMLDEICADQGGCVLGLRDALDAIASILEDTGSPAHMRVAAELRGMGDA